jgi:hypothetical protein
MAQDSGQSKSLQQLRQEVAHSRDRLSQDIEGMRYEIDFPLKFRKSFQRQTTLWIGAAVAVGLIVVLMPMRTKKGSVQPRKRKNPAEEILGAGLALSALKLAVTLFRPAITKFIARKVGDYAAGDGVRRRHRY